MRTPALQLTHQCHDAPSGGVRQSDSFASVLCT